MKPVTEKSNRRIGLARVLSKRGYCSRYAASELIRAGRVTLNGNLCRDPEAPVRESQDRIEVDSALVEARGKIYRMLNKPRGVVTTASDDKGRKTVYTTMGESSSWIAPVGRLDKASEGLLLFTNDSEWSALVTAPESHLDKTYHVQLAVLADQKFTRSLMNGVKTKDGEVLRAKQARPLSSGQKNSWVEIILDEGKNRHIRRMMEALDVDVLRLVRVAIGPLQLGDLAKGKSRDLSAEEKTILDRALGRKLEAWSVH
jgi:23S rRNA pseudouridine2605 synthase